MDYQARLRHVPDEELVAIIEGDSFVPDAVTAAHDELARRGLSSEQITQVRADVEASRQEDRALSTAPLGNAGMLAFLIFGPLLIITVPVALGFRAAGYREKSADAVRFIICSFLLYGVIAAGFGLYFTFSS